MIDIDVRCALGFSRATLAALATVSDEARAAVDAALAEQAAILTIDDLSGSAAVAAIFEETRASLCADAQPGGVRAQALERMLVKAAAEIDDDQLPATASAG